MKNTKVEISIKTLLIIVGIMGGVFVLTKVMDIVVMLLIAFVLMTAFHPFVLNLQKLKLSRPMAILTVYFILISAIIISIAVIVPPLADQTTKLFVRLNLPNSFLIQELTHLRLTVQDVQTLIGQFGGSVGTVLSAVTSTFSVIFSIFTVLVMTLYLLIERDHLYRYASLFFRTSDHEERGRRMFDQIEKSLGSWVRGEFILMVVIGLMTYIGLSLLGIPYALPLAIIAGILEALPNLGPTLSAIPAVIVAGVIVSPIMGVITAVLYMLIQAVENNVVVPQVMKNATGISPLISIVLILAGVRFGGVMGAMLVIPTYIIFRVVIREFRPEILHVFKPKE